MIYNHDGVALGEIRQSRSGRYYVRYPDGTVTPARWRTASDAFEELAGQEVEK